MLDSVDAVRVKEDSSHEMLREIQEKVTQLSQDVHNISNQVSILFHYGKCPKIFYTHYKNMPIRIYRKFYLQNLKIF